MTSLYNAANITATTTATQLSALLTTAGVDIGSAVTVGAGSFRITLANASGTTTEQPVINFAIIKGVSS